MREPIEKMYAEKKEYIEKTLAEALKPVNEFGSIQYARCFLTGEEFIKLTESNGIPWFINVTGNSNSANFKEVSRALNGNFPTGYVSRKEKQIEINKLFQKEA